MTEYETLNEILTLTVAQLFTVNRTSHIQMFKNRSQINEVKNDLPRSSIGGQSSQGGDQSSGNASSQEWVQTQGHRFLEETTRRLQIDTHKCLYKEASISNLGIDELNRLKRHVKNELKRYDQTFVSLFYC